MDMFHVLLVLNSIRLVFLQTCGELAVHEISRVGRKLLGNGISRLPGLSLEQCALECLLVKMCKSFNFQNDMRVYVTLCGLNSVNHNDDGIVWSNGQRNQMYVDIRNWTATVAGTCASRPCAENQRCLPTTPYRCIDIDCGIPPVLPVENEDTNMYYRHNSTSLGSRAFYTCKDAEKVIQTTSTFFCAQKYRRCNSDSSWSLNTLFCK